MIELYIIRHGQTDYNKKGIVQGSGIDSNINEKGKAQGKAFFDFYKDTHFDQVYCSTLKRTAQTLHPWTSLGYVIEKHAGLNEFHWGKHEGTRPSKAEHAEYMGLMKDWQNGLLHKTVEGGESPIEAWNRAKPFFDQVEKRHEAHRILICSHGRQIRVMFRQLLGMDMEDPVLQPHRNTALNILRFENGAYQATKLNDTQHLEVLEAST